MTWRIWARADIPWGLDLTDERYLQVVNVVRHKPALLHRQEPGLEKRLKVTLSGGVYEPSEMIEGKVVPVNLGDVRSIRISAALTENARAEGLWSDDQKVDSRTVGQVLVFPRELISNREVPFRIQLPSNAPCSYSGKYSSLSWAVSVTLDIPYSSDMDFSVPFTVGIKRAGEDTAGTLLPKVISPPPRAITRTATAPIQ